MRAHLLRGVVAAADAPYSKLGITALDGGGDAVGDLVSAIKVRGLHNGLPGHGRPAITQALEVLVGWFLGPVNGTVLAAVLLNLNSVDGLFRVLELAELGCEDGVVDCLGPLVKEAVDQLLHLCLEGRADAELVLEDDLLQVFDTTRQSLEPSRRALQLVGCADVEHEEAVDDGDNVNRSHVAGQKLSVPGLGTTVTADVDVEALVGGDEAEAMRC